MDTKLASHQAIQLIDVREPFEFEREKIEGARLVPLSKIPFYVETLDKVHPVVLVCASGARARQACTYFQKAGFQNVRILEGGIDAWKASGKPVVRGTSEVWALERQVRLCAGALVLGGISLSVTVSSHWIWLSAFVGAGLTFSALTNTCAMAALLSHMPWNRKYEKTCEQSSPQDVG